MANNVLPHEQRMRNFHSPPPCSFLSIIGNIEQLIQRRQHDTSHSPLPAIPFDELAWDYSPFSDGFNRLRNVLRTPKNCPIPTALRIAIHASLLEMEEEAERLNKDIELNQWRLRFAPRQAKSDEELLMMRTMRRDQWLDDLRKFEDEFSKYFVRNAMV